MNKYAHKKYWGDGVMSDHDYTEAQDAENAKAAARLTQIGGNHYKDMAIQPVEYIHKNNLGFLVGCVVKYVSRYKAKNGKQDLEKAIHCIQLLIEAEYERT